MNNINIYILRYGKESIIASKDRDFLESKFNNDINSICNYIKDIIDTDNYKMEMEELLNHANQNLSNNTGLFDVLFAKSKKFIPFSIVNHYISNLFRQAKKHGISSKDVDFDKVREFVKIGLDKTIDEVVFGDYLE